MKPRLTLGTVQLGLAYGKQSKTPLMSEDAALEILAAAVELGIRDFDTAAAYGCAEQRLGRARRVGVLPPHTRITTKLTPNLDADSKPLALDQARRSIEQSLHRLGQTKLDCLLLHRWEHARQHSGAVWDALGRLREEGVLASLGVSVNTPQEALEALADPRVENIQLPCNLLDGRWNEVAQTRTYRPDVRIDVRSVYLQGVLIQDAADWPRLPGVNAAEWIARLEQLKAEVGLESRQALCLQGMTSQNWISSIVFGVDSKEQLEATVRHAASSPWSSEILDRVKEALSGAPEILLCPFRWPTERG